MFKILPLCCMNEQFIASNVISILTSPSLVPKTSHVSLYRMTSVSAFNSNELYKHLLLAFPLLYKLD